MSQFVIFSYLILNVSSFEYSVKMTCNLLRLEHDFWSIIQ